jgi:hypothetical protein
MATLVPLMFTFLTANCHSLTTILEFFLTLEHSEYENVKPRNLSGLNTVMGEWSKLSILVFRKTLRGWSGYVRLMLENHGCQIEHRRKRLRAPVMEKIIPRKTDQVWPFHSL